MYINTQRVHYYLQVCKLCIPQCNSRNTVIKFYGLKCTYILYISEITTNFEIKIVFLQLDKLKQYKYVCRVLCKTLMLLD